MVVALVVFGFAGGLLGAGSALIAGLPLWAALLAYLAAGSISTLLFATLALLRPRFLPPRLSIGSEYR